MATKRKTKAVKRGKRVKDLGVKSTTARQAKGVRGGAFEIKDYSFGVENPTTIGSSTGGSSTTKK